MCTEHSKTYVSGRCRRENKRKEKQRKSKRETLKRNIYFPDLVLLKKKEKEREAEGEQLPRVWFQKNVERKTKLA